MLKFLCPGVLSEHPSSHRAADRGVAGAEYHCIGIAVVATLVERRTGLYASVLAENASQYNPEFLTRFQAYVLGFVGKGMSPGDAQAMSLKALQGSMIGQAQLLAYNSVYITAALMLLFCIPLFFLFRTRRNQSQE